MNLNDVLLTYNQVKAPQTTKIEEKIQLPDPVNSNMDRFLQYVNRSRDFDIDVDPDKMTYGFPGWIMANNADLETIERENNYYSNTSFMDVYNDATSTETSINAKIKEFTEMYPQKCNQFMTDLEQFYSTEYGKQFNPKNARNNEEKKVLEDMRKTLFSIAIMESGLNSQSVNNQAVGNEAFGYFQFIRDSGGSEELLNNINEQFTKAYQYLININNQIKSGIDNGTHETGGWSRLQIIYGMWWRPKSMMALLKKHQTNEDIENININVYGMNLARILARARTN